jgi:hypothetical protein
MIKRLFIDALCLWFIGYTIWYIIRAPRHPKD